MRPANGTRGRPGPPAPPSKRPVGSRAAAATAPAGRDSGYSTQDAGARDSGSSVAGGLAEALRARQAAMNNSKRNNDDEW